MKNKRGQVTLFIIIAIVIVAAIALTIYMVNLRRERISVSLESEVREIRDYIDSCVEISSQNVILEIGKKSGYYEQAELSTADGIAYYFDEEKNLTPTLEFIEAEINKGFNKELRECLGDFSAFEGLQIIASEPETSVDTARDHVEFNVKFSITIRKEGVSSLIDYSEREIIEVELKRIYNLAVKIVDEQLEESEYVYLTRFLEIPKPESLNVSVITEEGISIFNITDINAFINNATYSFLFAGKI